MSQFRRAFEAQEPEGEKDHFIVMKGPLSTLYTEALMKVYAKDKAPEGEETVSTESMANDALMMQALASDFGGQPDGGDGSGGATTVYGVSASDVNEDDFVNISKELAGPDKLVLIIDGTGPGPNSSEDSIPAERVEELSDMTDAMEKFVARAGGRVYHSLESFAQARRPRGKK